MSHKLKTKISLQTASFTEKIHESGNRYSFVFAPNQPISYEAGQYAHVLIPELMADEPVRKLSFVSSPTEPLLRFTLNIRKDSLYKQALMKLQPGDGISLFKIKGHLTLPEVGGKVVFIAGGIGMAPFRSLLTQILVDRPDLEPTLIQVDRENYLFEAEFKDADFAQHRVKREMFREVLESTVSAQTGATYYTVGTEQFVESIEGQLMQMGISEDMMRHDKFKGYIAQ